VAKYRIEISVEVNAESFQHATEQSRWLVGQLDYRAEVKGTWLLTDSVNTKNNHRSKEDRNETES